MSALVSALASESVSGCRGWRSAAGVGAIDGVAVGDGGGVGVGGSRSEAAIDRSRAAGRHCYILEAISESAARRSINIHLIISRRNDHRELAGCIGLPREAFRRGGDRILKRQAGGAGC